jgi:hypothetical protein
MTQDKLSEELLPCTFCGGEGRLILPALPLHADCTDIVVHCVDCGICGPGILFDQTEQTADDLPDVATEAVAAWNARALRSATPMPGVKALEWDRVSSKIWDARALGGLYRVKQADDETWTAFKYGDTFRADRPTADEAKAAAQADFEARIISALSAHPAREISEAEVARIDLATLKWWRELVDLNPADLAPRLDGRIAALEAARSPS